MTRTPAVNRDSLSQDQKAAYDVFVEQRGEVPTTGPASVMLNAPDVAQRGLELASFLRTDTSLSPRIRKHALYRQSEGLLIHLERPSTRRKGSWTQRCPDRQLKGQRGVDWLGCR